MSLTKQQKDVLLKQEKYLETLLHLHVKCVELYEQCVENVNQEARDVQHYVGLVQVSISMSCVGIHFRMLVYDLRTQNLNFVAPIPGQVGTTTMHFSEVSGDTY